MWYYNLTKNPWPGSSQGRTCHYFFSRWTQNQTALEVPVSTPTSSCGSQASSEKSLCAAGGVHRHSPQSVGQLHCHPPKAGDHSRRGEGKCKEAENQSRTESSGHNRTTAFMDTEQQWLPAPGQPSQHSNTSWGEAHEPQPFSEELPTMDSFWARQSQLSLRMWPLLG